MLTRRTLSISTAVAAATVTLASCSLLPGGRSTEAFCNELNAGNETMKQNYTSTDEADTMGMLKVAVDNMGEFTRLVRKLDDVAPPEIESDMHAVRQTWDAQADQVKNAFDNPLGALASGLMSSIMNAGSIQAVDTFAQENCGHQLFGTAG